MKNLLRGNFTKVLANDYKGFKGSLTPTNPLNPDDVDAWLRQFPLESLSLSGVRCFHDYILDPELRHSASEDQLALELRFSTQEPFMSLGRYIHRVLRRF
jgi:S-adenosylmethionine-dependent methyltransferase